MRFTRRQFVGAASVAALTFAAAPSRATSPYRRYIVTSAEGQKALASYAKGVTAMLNLPPDHPHNWFRNAFVHLMDCPHGNWWFYVWHRGFIGYLEEIVRSLSGDDQFALPYWDWTQLPRIPAPLFNGVLTPVYEAYKPYTQTYDTFAAYFKPSFQAYWQRLSSAQRYQLRQRGCNTLADLWRDVTGNGVPAARSFATTAKARYLSKANPWLDQDTTYAVSRDTVTAGLRAPKFNDKSGSVSFTSQKAASHNASVDDTTVFSILEGMPHNLVHNCVGGIGAIDPGPYGNMANFLSPVDPLFFLHHANMDRLWDVWTRRQMSLGRAYQPAVSDRAAFYGEPFLFFVDVDGNEISGKAEDYFDMSRFGYDYDGAGFGENLVAPSSATAAAQDEPLVAAARIDGNAASIAVPAGAMPQQAAAGAPSRRLIAEITLERPAHVREFRVFVGAPADAAGLGPDSPFYAGTIAFFGPPMTGMTMAGRTTFTLPLPPKLPALSESLTSGATSKILDFRIVPVAGAKTAAPVLKGVAVRPL